MNGPECSSCGCDLDCSSCSGAGCIPEYQVRVQLEELAQLMTQTPRHAWGEVSRELIDRWSACPISAGYAMYALSVDLQLKTAP